jgi:pyruvate,water dikinase
MAGAPTPAPKASLLIRAGDAGLPVPAGFVIPDGEPVPTDIARWAADQRAHRLAVRSAFEAEDGSETSLAGWFETVLDVAPDIESVSAAVDRVRDSARRRPGEFRRDVLVMAMVAAHHAGVAFSEPGRYDDLVNATTGTADGLVSGQVVGDRRELPRLERAEAGWPRRLQRLLSDVRRTFGDRPWDIEWADDGTVCWLLQIRPITAAPMHNETLTAANHAEILPPLPSHLMTSIIAEAGPDLFAWYRRRVPGLPADRHFLHVKAGRPMINLSLLEDMMRHLGLPTALVAGSIGGGSGRNLPLRPSRLVRSAPSLIRLGLAQVSAVMRAEANQGRVAGIGTTPATTFTEFADDLHRSYVALVTGMFPLSSAIGPPLGVLRRLGTLYEHAARHRTITTEMAERLRRLRAARSADGAELNRFLADFGHRGVYESDIARPRYCDDPSILLGTGGGPPIARTSAAAGASDVGDGPVSDPTGRRRPRTVKGWLTLPLWLAAAKPMAARERYRHEAMRSFAAIRDAGLALAGDAVARGRLGSVDDLWLLTADEVRSLDHGWVPDGEFWARRHKERTELAVLEVPHVIGLHDPVPAAIDGTADGEGDGGSADGGRRRLTGLALAPGVVSGTARVLAEPADRPLERTDGEALVVVARSIDAGWMTTLDQADAVVVEIGGDLSHGSILIRELGLPSVTNVAGATRQLVDGDRLRVDGAAGMVDRL